MINEDFNKNIDKRCERAKEALIKTKADEYTITGDDRLEMFKDISKMLLEIVDPVTVSLVLQAKNRWLVLKMVMDLQRGKNVEYDKMDDKLGADLNYDYILENLFLDSGQINFISTEENI